MTRLDYKTLLGPLLIWLCVVIAGLIGAVLKGESVLSLMPAVILMATPAILSMVFLGAINHPWAQAVVMLIWTAFGVLTTLIAGFIPQAVCFLAVPAIGMVFARERVVEGLILASIGVVSTYFAFDYIGASPMGDMQRTYLSIISVGGTLALTIAAMITGTQRRLRPSQNEPDEEMARLYRPLGPSADARPDIRSQSLQLKSATWTNAIAGGVLEFDSEGRLRALNENARSLFGLRDHPRDLLQSLTLRDWLFGIDGARSLTDPIRAARRQNRVTSANFRLMSDPTTPAHVSLRFSPLPNNGLIVHAIDRSEDQAQIDWLHHKQREAETAAGEKTLFFAGVSHELRTPLNAIIGFSDMMRSRLFGPLPGKYAEYADLIHDSGQYMLDLIGDVLDLSKVEVGKYQLTLDEFDVTDVVRSSIKMVRPAADAAHVRLDVTLPHDDPLLITADRKALRQILLNLLSNAIKFSPKKGRVTVHTAEHQGQIIIAVRDRGAGISADELSRIGQPFQQGAAGQDSESRGSGLGLSIVRSLTELHGGRFEIDSVPGDGTKAVVTLPVRAEHPPAA